MNTTHTKVVATGAIATALVGAFAGPIQALAVAHPGPTAIIVAIVGAILAVLPGANTPSGPTPAVTA